MLCLLGGAGVDWLKNVVVIRVLKSNLLSVLNGDWWFGTFLPLHVKSFGV